MRLKPVSLPRRGCATISQVLEQPLLLFKEWEVVLDTKTNGTADQPRATVNTSGASGPEQATSPTYSQDSEEVSQLVCCRGH